MSNKCIACAVLFWVSLKYSHENVQSKCFPKRRITFAQSLWSAASAPMAIKNARCDRFPSRIHIALVRVYRQKLQKVKININGRKRWKISAQKIQPIVKPILLLAVTHREFFLTQRASNLKFSLWKSCGVVKWWTYYIFHDRDKLVIRHESVHSKRIILFG